MTGEAYSETLLIIVRAEIREQANQVCLVAEPTAGETFRVPLVSVLDAADPDATPVAYWANWVMTPTQRQRILAEFGKRFSRAILPLPLGAILSPTDQFWVLEKGWDHDLVLTLLGFSRPAHRD